MRGIAVMKALSSTRSSGMIATSRSTRKIRNRRPRKAVSLPSSGIRLATTMTKSKTFQPFLKNFPMLSLAIRRMLISTRKKSVMPISSQMINLSDQSGIG